MSKLKNLDSQTITKLSDENKRLKKSIEDLQIINNLATIISSTMPVEQILDRVISMSVKTIQAEEGTISLLEVQKQKDQFKTLIRKVDKSFATREYRLDEDLSGWMIKHRKPLLISNSNFQKTFKRNYAELFNISSLLSVPLLCKGKLIGVLNLFNKKERGQFSNDDQRLLSIIASQSAQVIENARLYEEEKQLRRIEQELETARTIQLELLPKENPKIKGYDISGQSCPAREVGGDYFDFIQMTDNRWGITLGDVSGKGIPAALLMSNLQATIRNQALNKHTLVECVTKTNQFLCLSTESHKFATLFCGILELQNDVFYYVNAGHNFPFYLNSHRKFQTLQLGGIVLGLTPDCTFEEGQVKMQPGEIIVIYSDGVTEAENKQEELFGDIRLQNVILENCHLEANQIVEAIFKKVQDFTEEKEQEDDTTVVVIKKRKPESN